jgi:hypothetical protein
MMAYSGCFALTCWDGNQAGSMYFAISLEEVAIVGCRWCQDEQVAGVASAWRDSAKSSCARRHGTPSHARRGKPALMKLISMPTLSPETARKKGSEAVAAATGARE